MVSTNQSVRDAAVAAPASDKREYTLIVQWTAEHGDAIIKILEKRCVSRDHAEDVMQVTWQKAARYLHSGGSPPKSVRGWLLKIADNTAKDDFRKLSRENLPLTEFHESALVSPGVDPSTEAGQFELSDAMNAAIESLEGRQYAVIIMFYYDKYKKTQIADILGVSPPTVTNIIENAIENLRRSLSKFDSDFIG